MNFSLTAPNGTRAFCGVFFDSPSDELVVAPDWVMHRCVLIYRYILNEFC